MKIETWNVTTLKNNYRIDILTDDKQTIRTGLISSFRNSYPRGRRSVKLGDTEFVYSGRKVGVHTKGAGLTMDKEAAKSCLGWEGIKY